MCQPAPSPGRGCPGQPGTHQPPCQPLAADGAAYVLHVTRDVEDELPQPFMAFQALTGDLTVCAKGAELPRHA